MKIGIITYYAVVNYGAVLLAYSMQKTLEDMGHEVVFLQYKRVNEVLDKKKSLYTRLRGMTPNAVKARKAEAQKVHNFEVFRAANLHIGDFFDVPQDLDIIIVGSDQIFDCQHEFNDFQYAIGAACDKFFSYAPSFGGFDAAALEDFAHKQELQEALCRFAAHSARDDNTAQIITTLTGKAPVRVLDPALLYGFETEKSEWNQRLIDDKYMVVYTWGGTSVTETFKEGVLALAKKHGLKTVSVGDRRPWCDYDYSSAPPDVFFALYRHSEMVLTNMFHGTCFAVLNEKPFYTCVMEYNKNKLGDLLRFLRLDSQRIDDLKDIPKKDIPQIDYEKVNAFLCAQRETSLQYLKENLQ